MRVPLRGSISGYHKGIGFRVRGLGFRVKGKAFRGLY